MFAASYVKFINVKHIRKCSNFVKIVEVGPRDGLQNEPKIVPTSTKINFINELSKTGLGVIEVTSFVSPKWIPQMADNAEVFQKIEKSPDIAYPVLVPNLKGLETALKIGVKEVAVFISASETFSHRNINCSIEKSMERSLSVIRESKRRDVKVRAYVSCIVGCPYEGDIDPSIVATLAATMLDQGCYEISLGDTIGVGTPKQIGRVLHELKHINLKSMNEFAIHCHDTYGQALANVYASLDYGIRTFDSSVAALGGCPYAAGASGNVATEDLIYLLEGLGLETGVNLNKVIRVGEYISQELCRENRSKVGVATLAKEKLNKCI